MKLRPYLIGAAIGAAVALLLCWWMRPQPVPEPAAPPVHLPTGGLVLERDPAAPVPQAAAEDAGAARGKLERAVSITVRPNPIPAPAPSEPQPSHPPGNVQAEAAPVPGCSCEDVTVDLALIRMRDDTMRVTARARGGELLGGIDVPMVSRALAAPEPRWSALAMYGPDGYGGGGARRLGRLPLEVGAAAIKFRGEWGVFAVAQLHLN